MAELLENVVFFRWSLIAGVGVAILCGLLSVLVVLRRLAFIGQGVSHAAFGGVGLAAVLGWGAGGAMFFPLVGLFCVATALGIGIASGGGRKAKEREETDTLIGVFLVGSMSLGALLLNEARDIHPGSRIPPVESLLFGSIMLVDLADAIVAWGAAIAIVALCFVFRRSIRFQAFDEEAARAFGVQARRAELLLLALLGVAVVVAMQLAGVVLATALLVLPGATALRLSLRSGRVLICSIGIAILGVLGGLAISLVTDWPSGSTIAALLIAAYLLSRCIPAPKLGAPA